MAKKVKLRQYLVPMKWTRRGEACIEAASADDAVLAAETGKFEDDDVTSELVDWEVTGPARLDE